ncbi:MULTISPECIES: flagellar export chaperone FliS [unclassified Rhodanobacter]|jgi:flagellar protein FliS|uniref:Flagellar secretion chaperone FliS n=1 Tax=Rhodanobacter humi TaxID=1888173 RepID=A0ABV4AUK3_9GAMM
MTNAYMRQASAMYQQTRAEGRVEGADPHQLIAMLLDGAIERIAQARVHLRRGDVPAKGAVVTKAVAIVGELRASLNHEAGGSVAQRLDSLYDYVNRRLLFAQLNNDDEALAECARLLEPVRDGWNGIRDAYLAGRAGSAA